MRPFSSGDTSSAFNAHMEKILNEIKNLDNDYILNVPRSDLEDYYIEQALIEELELDVDNKYLDNKRSVKVQVRDVFDKRVINMPGTSVDLHVPFTGDSVLFNLRASRYSLGGYPDIIIRNNEIIFTLTYQDSNADGENIKKVMDSDLKSIIDAITNVNTDVKAHNSKVESSVRNTIEAKLENAKKSLNILDILDIPIKRKDDPDLYVVNLNRKLKISKSKERPKNKAGNYKPEPCLDMDEYNHILKILRGMSMVIERSPSTFSDLDEEAIRTHFLIQLNGHYEGSATGETFNKSGKTDILIRVDEKNIFIGECKFWKGKKAFNEAIDQLLGYLAWRDSKCALLIFNRNKNSRDVAEKMDEIIRERSEFKKVIEQNPLGDSKYIFAKESEFGQEIIITTQLYDIPGS